MKCLGLQCKHTRLQSIGVDKIKAIYSPEVWASTALSYAEAYI